LSSCRNGQPAKKPETVAFLKQAGRATRRVRKKIWRKQKAGAYLGERGIGLPTKDMRHTTNPELFPIHPKRE
jgi:hypothetical protein